MRSRTASVLFVLAVVVSLYGLFPSKMLMGGNEPFSGSTLTVSTLEKSAQQACVESPVRESGQNVCRAATRSPRPMIPAGAQVPAVMVDAVRVPSGTGPFADNEC